jgi:hypothetical protein
MQNSQNVLLELRSILLVKIASYSVAILLASVTTLSLGQDKVVEAPISLSENINNSLGYETHRKVDFENDGIYDYEQVKVYNERDIEYRSYTTYADTLTRDQVYTFDKDYNLVQRFWYDKNKSDPNKKWDLTYNINGQVISEYWDGNGDGTYERGHQYEYDLVGNRIKMKYDKIANGIFTDITTFEYDASNKLIKEVEIRDFTNWIPRVREYAYDQEGRKILFTEDTESDGQIDKTDKWRYDRFNNLVYTYYDYDGNGIGDNVSSKTYDAFSNLLFEAYSSEDSKRYTYYTYSSSNKTLIIDYDLDGDSVLDSKTIYFYDAQDSLSMIEGDTDLDGNPDSRTTYAYDANGRLIKVETDENIDGILESYAYYTYDSRGNIIILESYSFGQPFQPPYIKTFYTYDQQNRIVTQYTNSLFISGIKNHYNDDGDKIKIEYDQDGDSLYDRKDTFFTTRYFHCDLLGEGPAHRIQVDIPYSGIWEFDLCGSQFTNAMSLGTNGSCDSNIFYASDGCITNDAQAEVKLDSGSYYLTIAGQASSDTGNYDLTISLIKKLGINDYSRHSFAVYPNPASTTIHSHLFINQEVTITNAIGKNILLISSDSEKIDISELPSGIYTLTVQSENKVHYTKFLKQ